MNNKIDLKQVNNVPSYFQQNFFYRYSLFFPCSRRDRT